MNLSLLFQLCGLPLVTSLSLLCVGTTGFAIYLVLHAKRDALLSAFLPITILPVFAGLLSTLLGMISSVQMKLDATSDIAVESAFLLQMHLVPLFSGAVTSIPAMLVVVLGRWMLAWKASGLRLVPEKAESDEFEVCDERAALARDADEYLERLVQPR